MEFGTLNIFNMLQLGEKIKDLEVHKEACNRTLFLLGPTLAVKLKVESKIEISCASFEILFTLQNQPVLFHACSLSFVFVPHSKPF